MESECVFFGTSCATLLLSYQRQIQQGQPHVALQLGFLNHRFPPLSGLLSLTHKAAVGNVIYRH